MVLVHTSVFLFCFVVVALSNLSHYGDWKRPFQNQPSWAKWTGSLWCFHLTQKFSEMFSKQMCVCFLWFPHKRDGGWACSLPPAEAAMRWEAAGQQPQGWGRCEGDLQFQKQSQSSPHLQHLLWQPHSSEVNHCFLYGGAALFVSLMTVVVDSLV